MTSESFDQVLEAFLSQRPFKPFTVELQNANQFEIHHPRAVTYRGGVAVYLSPGGRPSFFDHENVVHFLGDLSTNKETLEE